jgi:hypothetical protein
MTKLLLPAKRGTFMDGASMEFAPGRGHPLFKVSRSLRQDRNVIVA